jgi:hypothetical protein
MSTEQFPGNEQFQTVLSGLSLKIRGQEQRWLELTLMDALWMRGEVATDENLHTFLPRLQMRSYPDGTIIVAIDAEPETEHRRGTRGRVLFGFGEGQLKQRGDSWQWERPLLDFRQAAAYEQEPRPASPLPLMRLEPEALWPTISGRMLEQQPQQMKRPDFPAPPPGFRA